ncbi:hypothetical protein WDZ92_39570, partial [Nostoc sp. NIES-2111]
VQVWAKAGEDRLLRTSAIAPRHIRNIDTAGISPRGPDRLSRTSFHCGNQIELIALCQECQILSFHDPQRMSE